MKHFHSTLTLAALLLAAPLWVQAQKPALDDYLRQAARYTAEQRAADDAATRKHYPMLARWINATPAEGCLLTVPKQTLQPKHAVVKDATATDSRELWGNVTYSDAFASYYERGMYSFTADNPAGLAKLGGTETNYSHYYMNANGGSAIQDGQFHMIYWYSGGGYVWVYKFTFDAETWQQIGTYKDYEDITFAATETATNQQTGTVYGSFYTADADGFTLGTIDYTTMTRTTIGTLGRAYIALGVTRDNTLYGIATDGQLYRISATTAEETLVGPTGVTVTTSDGGYYGQSGEIDQQTGTFYWACKDADGQTALYTVDLTTGEATRLGDFSNAETIYGLHIPTLPAEDGAPAAVSGLKASFDGPSLTGTVTFTLPTQTYGGEALSGTLSWTVTAAGETVAQGTGAAGESVACEVSVAEGVQQIGVSASNSTGAGPQSTVKVYAGNDTPQSVSGLSYTLDAATGRVSLAWNAPTEGVNGGYIGTPTYSVVRYPDSTTVATSLSATSFTETLDATRAQQAYSYGVTATNAGHASAEALTARKVFGAAIEPPYEEAFDTEQSLDLFTIIDANDDGSTWEYNENSDGNAVTYRYSRTNDGDDWLITPALRVKAETIYRVTFDVNSYGYGYTERIEAMYGSEPTADAMTHELLPATDITTSQLTTYTSDIIPTEAGRLHIGFHAISPADEYRLYLRNLKVVELSSTAVPDSVTQLRVTANADGKCEATGSFRAPEKTISGKDLGTSMTHILVLRNDRDTVARFESPAPGAELSFTDTGTDNDLVTYTVMAYNAEGAGRAASTQLYVGIDVPLAPENVRISDGGSQIHMTWNAVPTRGEHGGVVRPAEVSYEAYGPVSVSSSTSAAYAGGVEGQTAFSFDYDTTTGEQTLVQCGVRATSVGGESEITASKPLVVGKPYELPFAESLAGGNVSTLLWGEQTGRSSYSISTSRSADDDGGSLVMSPAQQGDTAWIRTGKLSLQGAEGPTLTFAYMAASAADAVLTVCVQRPDGTVDELSTVDYAAIPATQTGEWQTASLPLTAYTGLSYVVVSFRTATASTTVPVYIDNIAVRDLGTNGIGAVRTQDAATDVYTPAGIRVGQTTEGLHRGLYIVGGRKIVK